MSIRIYSLNNDSSQQLRISWQGRWRQITISWSEIPLRIALTFYDLKSGYSLILPNGLPLHLKIAFPYRDRDLIVTSQGVLLYGQDPALPALIRRTNAVMYIIASLLLALGLSARLIQSDIILTAGIGDHSTIIGILLLLCGRLIRSRSLLAMILSVFLLITHWLIGISLAAHLSATSSVTITLVHMVFVIPLFQGIFLIDASNHYPHFFAWARVAIIDTWRSIRPDVERLSTSR